MKGSLRWIVAALLLTSGCGMVGSKPQPPPDYRPVMPPGGGYGSTPSGMGAAMQQRAGGGANAPRSGGAPGANVPAGQNAPGR